MNAYAKLEMNIVSSGGGGVALRVAKEIFIRSTARCAFNMSPHYEEIY